MDSFRKYFAGCCDYLMEEQKQLKDQEEKLEASRKEINIDKEIEKKYITMRTTFDKDWGTLAQLADTLDLAIPQQIEEKVSLVSARGQEKMDPGVGDEKTLWEDESQKNFYRDLIEIKIKQNAESVSEVKKQEEGKKPEEIKKQEEAKKPAEEIKKTERVEEENKAELDLLLSRLPNCLNKDSIDQAAKDFSAMSSKHNRKILVKTLFNIQRTALPLIPFYARLAATLSKAYK